MFEPPELVNLHPDREARERAALWARAASLFYRDHDLNWARERLMVVSQIPSSRFVVDGHRTLAKEMDRCHAEAAAFEGVIPALLRNVPAGEVLEALELKTHDLVIEFRAMARLPMTRDLEISAFGGTSAITLRAGPTPLDKSSFSQELTAIVVRVPIEGYGARARPTDVNDFDIVDVSREALIARNALDHVLNVLRLKQVQVFYSDYESEHGAPFRARVELKFGDKTVRREPSGLTSGWLATSSPHPGILVSPLQVSPDLFAETYKAAATEIALFSASSAFSAMDHLRRQILVIESTHSHPEHGIPENMSEFEAVLRERPFIERLERLRRANDPSLESFPDDLALASELAALRHLVNHLQVRDARVAKIEERADRFGIDPFDADLAVRVARAIPVATAVARQILSELVPSQTLEAFRERKASLHELLKLRKRAGYIHDRAGTDLLARRALGCWFDEQDRDPEMVELVSDVLDDGDNQELAMSFVHIATLLPETHERLFAAIVRNGLPFAKQAIQGIRAHAPELLGRLKDQLPKDRHDLIALLDDAQRTE